MSHHINMPQDHENVHFYPEEELVKLIHSLDRDEDQHLFAQDVILTYPYLAEEYNKVCPHRMDLQSAAARAAKGDYSYDDVKLNELRNDIDLMVNNCVRYNGESHPLSEIAENFQYFAHEAIDAYIASKTGGRRVSLLRLQSSHNPLLQQQQNNNSNNRWDANAMQQMKTKPIKPPTLPSCNELSEFIMNTLVRKEDANAFVVDVTVAYPELKESYEAICPTKMNLVMMRERAQGGYYTYETEEDNRVILDAIDLQVTENKESRSNSNSREDDDNNNNNNNNNIRNSRTVSEHNSNSNSNSNSDTRNNKSSREDHKEKDNIYPNKKVKKDDTSHESSLHNETKMNELRLTKVYGTSVANSLHRLREDLELIVNNCIRFNINVEAWVKLALSFRKFAHRKVDELVLRHAPSLRGTATGVEVYVKQIQLEHVAKMSLMNKALTDSVLFKAQQAANEEIQNTSNDANYNNNNINMMMHFTEGTKTIVQEDNESVKANNVTVPHEEFTGSEEAIKHQPYHHDQNEEEKEVQQKIDNELKQEKLKKRTLKSEREDDQFTLSDHKGNNNSDNNKNSVNHTLPQRASSLHIPPAQVIVSMTTPSITPTPLQPELTIPASLRAQIMRDYLHRGTITLKRIGKVIPVTSFMVDTNKEDKNNNNNNDNNNSNTLEPSSPEYCKVIRVTHSMTGAFVLNEFVHSVHEYYHSRRNEPHFNTAFDYAAHDEQLYVDVIHIIAQEFNQLFLSLLLFPHELAEAHAWHTLRLLSASQVSSNKSNTTIESESVKLLNSNNTESGNITNSSKEQQEDNELETLQAQEQQQEEEEEKEIILEESINGNTCKVFNWLEQVHYHYLVRFLVQFPQLACLICSRANNNNNSTNKKEKHTTSNTSSPPSTTSNVNNNTASAAHVKSHTLHISRDVLVLLQRVTKIVSECLQFIADYEEQLAKRYQHEECEPEKK